MSKVKFQKSPLDLHKLLNDIGTDSDGSVVHFIGRARKNSRGKEVLYLEYEIYEDMARRELEKILVDANNKWPLNDSLVVHRYGRVEIKETSIIIAVSSPHRAESFQAAQYIIDEIKQKVPIWKKEFYKDGSNWISDRS